MDVWRGAWYFTSFAQATAVVVAQYMVDLAGQLLAQGYKRVSVYLDGNATHRQAMRKAYTELSHGLGIEVDFVHFAPYSPWMNVVEYGIHWLRQRYLHQADSDQTLADVEARLTRALATHQLLTADQVINILSHIEQETVRRATLNHSP